MRPDNKKAGSGQATGKDGHLLSVNGHSQRQYSKSFDTDKHIRAARRTMGDAVIMLSGWPACIRYSYFVGPDGKLITRAERRGAK